MNNQKKSSSKVLIAVIACLVLIMIVGGVAFAFMLKKNNEMMTALGNQANAQPAATPKREYVVTEKNVEEVKAEIEAPVEDAYYNVTMNVKWKCSSETLECKDAYVANSQANNRTVYFNVMLPDTEEVIYSSPFIPVGSELRGITLDKALPLGENPVWVEYHLVDENEQELTTVTVEVIITVK